MSPFNSVLTAKISPLIDGQMPDFVQADHSKFVSFVRDYYKFLEAAELNLTTTIDYIAQETTSSNYILDESSKKIVTETGAGTLGKFTVGETITGGTSNATATVLIDDLTENKKLFISSQQKFIVGETVTGGTSSATGIITKYRGNPVQNIQQLMDYANTDNTTDAFLDQMLEQFVHVVPKTMASGTSKRDLIKNIKDLYAAKGTSEGHKLFMRLLFDEEADISYPNKFMLKPSAAEWTSPTVMRTVAVTGSDGLDVTGQTLTGQISGATAVVVDATIFAQGAIAVTEFKLDTKQIKGTFVVDEIVTCASNTLDVTMKFTVGNFITSATVTNGGILYEKGQNISVATDDGGNGYADIEVEDVLEGSVDGVAIDAGGDNYRTGDVLTFASTETDIDLPAGIVSVVGGSFLLEDTVGDDDYLILEPSSVFGIVPLFGSLNGTDSIGTDAGGTILLERTATDGSDAGDYLIIDEVEASDYYGTDNDQIILEEKTLSGVDIGTITRALVTKNGGGLSKLPTISVTSSEGTGEDITALTSDIGKILSVKINDGGFNYSAAPKTTCEATFILKDVTGAYVLGNSFTTHTGSVITFDTTSKTLRCTITDSERIEQETSGTINEFMRLEDDGIFDGVYLDERFTLNSVLEEEGYFSLENGTGQTGRILSETGSDLLQINNHIIDEFEEEGFVLNEDGSYVQNEAYLYYIINEEFVTTNQDRLLFEDEIYVTDAIDLNGTNSSGHNAGSSVTTETVLPSFVGETLSTSGASGTIVKSDIGKVSLSSGVTSVLPGYFTNTDHQISEFTVRLQDSIYYQDFSYEIKIGQSTSLYLNELKGTVHPAGFLPFGKVTLATLISAALQIPTAGLISGFTADTTTFTPELASILETIFTNNVQRRLEVPIPDYEPGSLTQQLLMEDIAFLLNGTDGSSTDAGSKLLLDSTDGSSDAGSSIIGEQNEKMVYEDKIVGRIMSQASYSTGDERKEVSLLGHANVSLQLPSVAPSFDTGLKFFAGGRDAKISEFGGIEMEDGTREAGPTTQRSRILLNAVVSIINGTLVNQGELLKLEDASNHNIDYGLSFNDLVYEDSFDLATESGNRHMVLDGTNGASANAGSAIVLDGTTSAGTDANENILSETCYLNYEAGTPGYSNRRIATEGIPFSNVKVGDIMRPSIILLDRDDNLTAQNVNRNDIGILTEASEEPGAYLLEERASADDRATERKNNEHVLLEDRTGVQHEGERNKDGFGWQGNRNISADPEGVQAEGHRGSILLMEHQGIELEDGSDEGTIPYLNKTKSRWPSFARPSKIHIHTRGRIAWQDETSLYNMVLDGTNGASANAGSDIVLDGTTSAGTDENDNILSEKGLFSLHPETPEGGFALLNGTDGSSTNAGEYLEYERGTWNSLSGSYSVFVGDKAEKFDAQKGGFFSSGQLTWDRSYGDG